MRIIDARSGKELSIGDVWTDEWQEKQLLSVEENLLTARATIAVIPASRTRYTEPELMTVPLQVRFTHPSYFLQKVAFIPS